MQILSPLLLLRAALVYLQIPFLIFGHIVSNLLRIIAPKLTFKLAKKLLIKVEFDSWPNNEEIKDVEDLNFLFSWDIKKWKVQSEVADVLKPAKLGAVAPNPRVVNLSDKKISSLLSFAKEGRPFVLNFGSCT